MRAMITPDEVAALRAAPADDALRAAIAERYRAGGDDARASFITMQCQLERIRLAGPARWELPDAMSAIERSRGTPERQELDKKIRTSWELHVSAWLGELGLVRNYEQRGNVTYVGILEGQFVRGFVESLHLPAQRYAEAFELAMARAPIRKLRLEIASKSDLAENASWFTGLPLPAGFPSPSLDLIEELDLRANRLEPDTGRALASAPSGALHTLLLDENDLGDEGIAALASARFPALRRLDLASNKCGADGPAALAGAPWIAALEDLSVGFNAKRSQGFDQTLARVIAAAPRLQVLQAPQSSAGDATVRAIANAPGSGLRGLFLFGARVSNAGVAALAGSSRLGSLQTLVLGSNPIDDDAAFALAHAASTTLRSITALGVGATQITDRGLAALRDAFAHARIVASHP